MLPNVRAFADGEIDLVRAICLARLKAVQASAIALVAAALLCLSALTALLVGLVIALGPIIGPFVATFAVSLGALAVGAIIAIYAAGRLKAVFSAPIMDETRAPQESYGHDTAQANRRGPGPGERERVVQGKRAKGRVGSVCRGMIEKKTHIN